VEFVDVMDTATSPRGSFGAGAIHHVAFRVPDEQSQLKARTALINHSAYVTPVRDRQYFRSIYFHEPGGALFEIATDGPGFLTDESPSDLGSSLKLPPWLEPRRADIEHHLPPLGASAQTP
jgi:glyoxalase family protein